MYTQGRILRSLVQFLGLGKKLGLELGPPLPQTSVHTIHTREYSEVPSSVPRPWEKVGFRTGSPLTPDSVDSTYTQRENTRNDVKNHPTQSMGQNTWDWHGPIG